MKSPEQRDLQMARTRPWIEILGALWGLAVLVGAVVTYGPWGFLNGWPPW